MAQRYYPFIGDPCYKYSRGTKEKFFKIPECSFLYLLSKPEMDRALRNKVAENAAYQEIQTEFENLAWTGVSNGSPQLQQFLQDVRRD